jgi:hypothetical protein
MKWAILALSLLIAPAAAAELLTLTCDEEGEASCDREMLTARMIRERDQVAAFLGVAADRPIAIHVGTMWRGRPIEVAQAWPEFGRIVVPTRILARGIAPTAHEITHVLVGRGAGNLMTEGLAVLTHARFGEQPAFPNFGRPLEQALGMALSALPQLDMPPTPARINAWIDGMDDFQHRRLGYLLAGLFCQHLLLERLDGDRARFLRLYKTGDYDAIIGETADAAFARWWAKRAA